MHDAPTAFDTYGDWLAWWFSRPAGPADRVRGLDRYDRPCLTPADFRRARDEDGFPVRLLAPEGPAAIGEALSALATLRGRVAALEVVPVEACALLDALERGLRDVADARARLAARPGAATA